MFFVNKGVFVEMQKQILREEYQTIRNNIKNKKEKSQYITEKLKQNILYKNAKIVALYKSLPSEVDTAEIIEHALSYGKIVVLPKVVGEELRFYKIGKDEVFVKSKFGVEEPIGDERNFIDKNELDLVIVPGLCFDEEGNRLGFGKGYYDRFLANTELKTIAVCFKEQIIRNGFVPVDSNDVKMQMIITDDIE